MTDRIEPALSAEESERVRSGCDDIMSHYFRGDKGAVIAAVNDELPESDPRKITRAQIAQLRFLARMADKHLADWGDGEASPDVRRAIASAETFADALESYLPPAEPS